jgi:hypothetical protein
MRSSLGFLGLVSAILVASSTDANAQFVFIDLNPTGILSSEAGGASEGRQVGFGFGAASSGADHALLWNGTSGSAVDLHPAGFTNSGAASIAGIRQAGSGVVQATGATHALLWTGTAESVIDLNPVGFSFSRAIEVSSGQQVGSGGGPSTGFISHALLWSGTAATAVDLNPQGFFSSEARGLSDTQQVGVGNFTRAILWSGTADSAIDLTPFNAIIAEAFAVSDGQQVGYGMVLPTFNRHALLWNGSAASAVDLNPAGFVSSEARGVKSGQQVGFGLSGGHTHALLWTGSAASAVDLSAFLPPGYTDAGAFGIDENGNIVGFALGPATANFRHAVLWTRPIKLTIDIHPDGQPNSINPGSRGRIPVAILSTPAFDPTTEIDRGSVTFGRTGDEASLETCNSSTDLNGDNVPDLLCLFSTELTGFESGNVAGILRAHTVGGVPATGSDSIQTIPR